MQLPRFRLYARIARVEEQAFGLRCVALHQLVATTPPNPSTQGLGLRV